MSRKFLIAGSIFGLLAVILGAFAAHGLKPILTLEQISSFETGVRFQMYHAFLLLIIGAFQGTVKISVKTVFYLIICGIMLFSGSIYLLATNSLTKIDFSSIALLTPLGGSLLIIGWLVLMLNFIKLKKQ